MEARVILSVREDSQEGHRINLKLVHKCYPDIVKKRNLLHSLCFFVVHFYKWGKSFKVKSLI